MIELLEEKVNSFITLFRYSVIQLFSYSVIQLFDHMFQSTLIIGGDEQQRTTMVTKILARERIVSYDTVNVAVEEGSTSIKIEQARNLIRNINIPPVNSPWKVAVISELQRATVETQNALLKLLEEPPSYARIVVTADAADKLLPTIVSRCHILKLTANSLRLTAQVEETSQHALETLFKSGAGERFTRAGEIGKDRETAVAFLKEAILLARSTLLSKYSRSYQSLLIDHCSLIIALRTLSRALNTLENTNTNPRLLTENLLLQL